MDPREEKLPKWAQSELSLLRMRNAEMQRSLEERTIRSKHQQVAVWGDPYGDHPIPLAALTDPILFGPDPDSFRDRIQVQIVKPGVLEIHGGDRIAVFPSSSNMIRVEVVCK